MLFAPRLRSAFDRSPKEGGLSPRSEGAVRSTTVERGMDETSGDRLKTQPLVAYRTERYIFIRIESQTTQKPHYQKNGLPYPRR
jgi:hypothetical protein